MRSLEIERRRQINSKFLPAGRQVKIKIQKSDKIVNKNKNGGVK